ncbi:hypothetical protein Tco_0503675 [Tanacetum coccineum]
MAKPILNKVQEQNLAEPRDESNMKFEFSKELLIELQNNTFNGRCKEDVIGHIGKVLEIVDLVKITGVDPFQLRMKAFPLSLLKDVKTCLPGQTSRGNVQAQRGLCYTLPHQEGSATPTDSHSIPIISQPSSSKPQKKMSRRKQRKESGPIEPITDEAHVSTPSYDPPESGEDSMQLSELMNLCTSLQEKVLDLEKAKTAQVKEITSLKKRVKQLEKRSKSRPSGLRRLSK